MANDPNLDRLMQVLTQQNQPPQKPQGVKVSDYAKELAGGAEQAVGYGLRGIGEAINAPARQGQMRSRDLLVDASPLINMGDKIANQGTDVSQNVSPAAQAAVAGSQPEGEILHPSTWKLGENPSLSGYALQTANVVGQIAPIIATGGITKGRILPTAGVAAALGGGAAGAPEQQRIEQMSQADLEKVPEYQAMIAGGMKPDDARTAVAQRAGSRAALTTMPVSSLSAFTEGLPIAGFGQKALSKVVGTSRLARMGAGAVLDAGAEGAQEAAEQAAQTLGANTATGENRSLGTDTFQNAILGALGGVGPGAVGGLHHIEGHEAPGAQPGAAPVAGEPAATPAGETPEAAAPVTPTPVAQTPAFAPNVNPNTGKVQVAPGVEVDENDGPLQKSLAEGAAQGAMHTPATTQMSDGSTVNTDTGELLTPPNLPAEAPAPSQTEKPEEQAPAQSASVPFMITAAMRRELADRGYDSRSIGKMTPQEANDILSQPAATKTDEPMGRPGNDELDAIVSGYYDTYGLIDAKTTGMIARRFGVSRQDVADAKARVNAAQSAARAAQAAPATGTESAATPAFNVNEAPAQSTLELSPTPQESTHGEEAPQSRGTEQAQPAAAQERSTGEDAGSEAAPAAPSAPSASTEGSGSGSDTGHAAVANGEAGRGSEPAASEQRVGGSPDESGAVPANEAGQVAPEAKAAEAKPAAETAAAPAAEPVKWFGSQAKADGYVKRKKLGDTHEVVQNGQRFEIRPKAEANTEAQAQAAPAATENANAEAAAPVQGEQAAAAQGGQLSDQAAFESLSHAAKQQALRDAGARKGLTGHVKFANLTAEEQANVGKTARARLDAERQEVAARASKLVYQSELKGKQKHGVPAASLAVGELGDRYTISSGHNDGRQGHGFPHTARKTYATPEEARAAGLDDIERQLTKKPENKAQAAEGDRIRAWVAQERAKLPPTKPTTGNPVQDKLNSAIQTDHLTGDQLSQVNDILDRGARNRGEAAPAKETSNANVDDGGRGTGAATPQGEQARGRAQEKGQGEAGQQGAPVPAEGEPAPVKAKPKASANTIFTEDAATKARALLKSKLGQLSSGIDPEIMQAGITLAGYHIEKGARTFAAYAKAMIADLGEAVRPYLKSWYMGVKYDPRANAFEGMDAAATVEATDETKIAAEAPTKEASNESANPDGNGSPALGEVPAGENQAPESQQDVGGRNAERGRGGATGNRESDAARVPATRSRGSGPSEARATATRGRSGNPRPGEARVGGDGQAVQGKSASVTPPAPTIPAHDFKITDEVELGKGGEATKFNDNLAAIRTLKTLETDNRRATPAEQAVLARYVGWGGLANAFVRPDGTTANGWEARAKQLTDLLTPKELAAARRSTRNAHYTSVPVVRGVWSAMERMGFAGGTVLEPSMGTGNFIGLRPDSLRGAQFVGVELDPLTARIAGALYPGETVLNSGFQKVPLADNTFDAVVQNPPFGQESLNFQYKPELNGLSIHNQFALAGMDALKPGGTMGMVVSRYLMDAKDATTRERLANAGELVGAIRLPDTAFKENARTEVVTDMLMFRKFTDAEKAARDAALAEAEKNKTAPSYPAWVGTTNVRDPLGGEPITVNGYFAANPSMILGSLERSGKMAHGQDVTVRGIGDMQAAIDKAVSALPKNVAQTKPDAIAASRARYHAMTNSLKLAMSGAEAGEIRFTNDGKLEQVIERETPTGDYELTTRTLGAESPWSPSLYMDADGHWFSLVEKTDEKGNKVKKVVDGKKTNLNVYTRKVYANDDAVPERQKLGAAAFKRLNALAKLRDMLKTQLTLEAEDAPDSQLTDNRTKLREAYQAFQKSNGYINERRNASLVMEMPDGALVLALEHGFRAGSKTSDASATMAPILTERVVEPYTPPTKADSAADALSISRSETGHVDLDRVASLLGTDRDGAVSALQAGDKPLIFHDPEEGEWVARDEYLTGNVRRKLAAAKDAHLANNIAELERVQPEPWGAENVSVKVGANWVPSEVYGDFAEHLMGGKAHVFYSPLTNSYNVSVRGGKTNADFGTESVSTDQLLSDMLNSRSTVIRRRIDQNHTVVDEEATALATQARKAIEREFADWSFADQSRRNALVGLFNDKFNTRVARQYDGSHLTLPGKVPDAVIRMRRHQNNAIWRGISQRFMLADHAVGAGKTFTAIARAMERRRMGLARKPMITVPNHLVEQWASDVYRLYPGAKVLAASNKDFTKARRRRLFAKIATGDWDAVIVPHSSFGFIGISPDTEGRYLEAEIDRAAEAINDAQEDAEQNPSGGFGKPIGVKEAERLKEKLEARLSKLNSGQRDKLLTFEQMGVDDLTVDEAHEFKNLFYTSRLTGVRGMGNKEGSRKALDLYNKVRVLRESPTGAVTFLTGTPISNSAVEMYTMMRYLAADELGDMGLENFDAWRSQFVDAEPAFEPTETGSLKEVTRLGRSWANMRSLMELYSSFTDSVSNDDIEKAYAEDNKGARFPIPDVEGGERQSVVVQPTPAQVQILNEVIAGFKGLKHIRNPKERNKERLRLMDRARKVALDARAAGGQTTDNEAGGKLQVMADEIASTYRKWDADKGTQLVFLDRSVPKAKGDKAIIDDYDKLKSQADAALLAGDDEKWMGLQERLEKFNPNEIEELRAAQNGGWNAYQQLKDNLVERGIPADQIRFVQEANTDAQKKELFDAVNAGEVRVLIGSTPRMGAGTNVQERLVALHHGDATWKPSDIEQREGRIIRQGNTLLDKYGPDKFKVGINAYATERTIDAKMWDLNSQKLKTINAIRKYNGEFNMDFEDEDAVGMAEMAALASGDPLLMERVKLASEIDKLELLERAQRKRQWGLQSRLDDAKRTLETAPASLEKNQQIAALLDEKMAAARTEHEARTVNVEGQSYATLPDAQRAVLAAIDAQKAGDEHGKFTVDVDGAKLTTKADAETAVASAMGDVEPFTGNVDGKSYGRRTDMARAVATNIGDARALNGKKVGEMFGLPLVADLESTENGRVLTLTLQGPKGDTLLSVDGKAKTTTGPYSTNEVRPLVSELAFGVNSNYARGRVANIQSNIRRANETIPEVEAQLAKPPPAELNDLPARRERLQQVITELAAKEDALPNQPGGVAFSKAETAPAGKGTPADVLERMVAAQTAKWKNAPVVVRVVKTASELPSFIQQAEGFDPNVEAAHDNGAVYLVADRLASVQRAQAVLAHEVIGHYGVEQLLGKEGFAQVRDQIVKLRDSGKFPELFAEIHQRYGDLSPTKLAGETMAVMAEKGMRNTLVGRMMAAVRTFLRNMGFNVAFSEGDLRQIVTNAGKYIERSRSGPRVMVQRVSFGMKPYGERVAAKPDPFVVNNASGESAASIEAINRLRDEQAAGKVRLLIEPNGSVRPLLGVDAVDTFARKGQVIVQRGVGKEEWTAISTDPAMNKALSDGVIARARPRLDTTLQELNGDGEQSWGQDDDELPGVAWSKRDPNDVAQDIERAAKFRIGDIVDFMRDKREDWRPGWLGMLTLRQLADVGKRYLPRIQDYADEVQLMQTRRNLLTEGATGTADKWWGWARKNREANKTLAGVMHDATLAGVDPDKAFAPGVVTLGSGEIVPMTEDAVKAALAELTEKGKGAPDTVRRVLDADIERIKEFYANEAGRAEAYPDLKKRFDAMPTEAKELYREVRQAYEDRSKAMQTALLNRIGGLTLPEGERKALADRVRAHFESARVQGPYFPLARFGEYWVSAEKNGVKEFRMMENRAQQRRVQDTYTANGWKTTAGAKIDMARAIDGASASFMAKVTQTMAENGVPHEVADEVYQLYLRTLPDLSVRKQFIHRKGTAGFDEDALRAFAGQMNHGAYQLARLEHTHKMEKILERMRDDAATLADKGGVEGIKAARAITEVNKRHEWVMNPTDAAWVQKITAANFAYYLGATPASAFVNLTQGAITTFPALAAKHGWIKAMTELTKGMRQSIRTFGNLEKVLTGDEAQAYADLSAMGAIDKTRAHDLAGMGEGSLLSYNPAWRKTMGAISGMFHKSEVFNREAAGLAAYRLARQAGESHDAAVKYAADTIFDTHFDYSNANRARFMQGNTSKVIFAFRQYSQHMLYYIWRNFYQSVRGATQAEKVEARKKLVGTLGMTAVFSGVMGLPMMTLAFGVANAFHHMFGDPDEPWDAETEFRNFLVEMLGSQLGKIAQDGPMNALTGMDIASRTKLDQLWFRAPDQELEGRALYDYWLEQIAGPVGQIFGNAIKGYQLYSDGELMRGVETVMPKVVRDSLKTMRYATQGVNDLRGDPLVKDVSPFELLMQAAGFAPAKISEQYTANNAMANYEKALTSRRQSLMDAYAMAVRMRDTDAIRAATDAIDRFNGQNPEIGITAGQIRRSLMAREKYSERTVNGLALNPRLASKIKARVGFAETGSE